MDTFKVILMCHPAEEDRLVRFESGNVSWKEIQMFVTNLPQFEELNCAYGFWNFFRINSGSILHK